MSLEGEKRKKPNKKREGVQTDETKKLHELLLVTAGEKLDICSKACCLDFFSLVAVVFVCVCFFLLGLCHFYGQL